MKEISQESINTTEADYFFLTPVTSKTFYESSTIMTRLILCLVFFSVVTMFLSMNAKMSTRKKIIAVLVYIPFTILISVVMLFYANIFNFFKENLVRNYVIIIAVGIFAYIGMFYLLYHIFPASIFFVWIISIYGSLELRLLILDLNVYSCNLKFMGDYLPYLLTLSIVPELIIIIFAEIMLFFGILLLLVVK